MAELKTHRTSASVDEFIDAIPHESVRQDCRTLTDLLRRVTGAEPEMWGDSIVGFGDYHYKYASGRENDWFYLGFAPRKRDLALYVVADMDRFDHLLQQLGKHRTSKYCLYVKRLSDIELDVLEQIAAASLQYLKDSEASN
jgi:hypothetical protein